ncbi:hypothetical protein BCR44DRAFT_1211321 [Catenaria anguillulae PL171]|uniref:Uncharacterized protein n=1 Tax=Catenaria anguillulae PL171 TaxID=765915 RepID=A0A1Y2HEK5_9FUNG|nr:hypothetical protein BCR44DRAFT_1211321 [Catenaria anguillulae PL171]
MTHKIARPRTDAHAVQHSTKNMIHAAVRFLCTFSHFSLRIQPQQTFFDGQKLVGVPDLMVLSLGIVVTILHLILVLMSLTDVPPSCFHLHALHCLFLGVCLTLVFLFLSRCTPGPGNRHFAVPGKDCLIGSSSTLIQPKEHLKLAYVITFILRLDPTLN